MISQVTSLAWRIALCLLLSVVSLSAHDDFITVQASSKSKSEATKTHVCLTCYNVGMFESFLSVLGALKYYENGEFSGVKVAFGADGQWGTYCDLSIGPNWWEYYFEPIEVGNLKGKSLFTCNGPPGTDFARFTEFCIYRKEANELIKRYIHVKPHITKQIEKFAKQHFKEKLMIGVHYRGTDKAREAPRAAYEEVLAHVHKVIAKNSETTFQIFVATDEQGFLDFMKEQFPSQVVCYEESTRSQNGQPVHMTSNAMYKKGEDALIDCLLLSKCKVLIKTSSNLSLCSAYFNPKMKMIHVTVRPWHAPLE